MSQASRPLGRFRQQDGRATRVGDTAEKMELARFPGHHVVAEREGDELVIYQIGDPDGLGVIVSASTADGPPRTIADLQRVYDAANGQRKSFQEKRNRHAAGEALADRVRAR